MFAELRNTNGEIDIVYPTNNIVGIWFIAKDKTEKGKLLATFPAPMKIYVSIASLVEIRTTVGKGDDVVVETSVNTYTI